MVSKKLLNYNLCADVSIFAGGPEKNLKKTEIFLFLEMINNKAN